MIVFGVPVDEMTKRGARRFDLVVVDVGKLDNAFGHGVFQADGFQGIGNVGFFHLYCIGLSIGMEFIIHVNVFVFPHIHIDAFFFRVDAEVHTFWFDVHIGIFRFNVIIGNARIGVC